MRLSVFLSLNQKLRDLRVTSQHPTSSRTHVSSLSGTRTANLCLCTSSSRGGGGGGGGSVLLEAVYPISKWLVLIIN